MRLGHGQQAKAAPPDANSAASPRAPHTSSGSDSEDNDYDKARQALLRQGEPDDGWKVELESYLKDPAADITKATDTVLYWQVS